ncbi:MAG TPA: prephenate dehydratase [Blastocatellia bacterium]|nr:prephenate dehydratase [Blastocatellia bacterium]
MTNDNGNAHIKAAYQGEGGAFSEMAAHRMLGPSAEPRPFRTFDEIFETVSRGNADCCVVPIENSLAGSVHKNYDLMLEHSLTIIAETTLRIVHNLIAPPGTRFSDVRRAYSHPVALAQCERFFRANPQIEAVPSHDTAGSVREVIERGAEGEAAIAGAAAARVYSAEIIAEEIEDNRQNFTRFLLLAPPDGAAKIKTTCAGAQKKTSIVFSIKNQPGSLFRTLATLALRDIDLAKIESRPIEGRPWEYMFYIDLVGDIREQRVERALAHLAEMAETVRVLGTYSTAGDLEGRTDNDHSDEVGRN